MFHNFKTKKILRLGFIIFAFSSLILSASFTKAAQQSANLTGDQWKPKIDDTITFTVDVKGSTGEPLSYYIWWNCNGTGGSGSEDLVKTNNLRCGSYSDSALSTTETTKQFLHKYTGGGDIDEAGMAYAFVVIKQGGWYFTANRFVMSFNLPTPTPTPTTSVTVTPSTPSLLARLVGGTGGVAPYSSKNTAYATSANNSGKYNYYFYCNRSDTGTSLDTSSPFETILAKIQSSWTMANACSYTNPGTYSPKVIIKQGSLLAQDRMNIIVTSSPTYLLPTLTLNPNPSDTTKIVTLTAIANTNNPTDTINYSYWWDCSSTANSYAQAVSDCGDPTNPTIGDRKVNYAYPANSFQHLYSKAGIYQPKIVLEQGNASASTVGSLQVNEAPPVTSDLSVNLSVSPAESSPGQSVELNAVASSNVPSGNYSYSFWWNCEAPSALSTFAQIKAQCGDSSSIVTGQQFNNQPLALQITNHVYLTANTYHPLVYVEHAGVGKLASAYINVVKPTLVAGLTINPTSANGSAKQATLTASAGGTSTGSVNYTFWWNCNIAGTNITDLTTKCGNPLDTSKGAKYTIDSNQKLTSHDYIQVGTFYPKVVVERGSADPQEARTQIIINSVPIPTLNVSLNAVRTSADNALPSPVNITANISGNATGQTNYKIWWDCQPNTQDFSKLEAICGNPNNSAKGAVLSSLDNETTTETTTNYALAGLRHPFVLAQRQSVQAIADTEINIPEPGVADTLTANLTLVPSSINKGETVKIDAVTQSNNSTDSYNYYFWWNCPDVSSLVLNDLIATCGDPSDSNIGEKFIGLSKIATSKEVSRQYNEVILAHPRVFVEHGTVSANSAAELVVGDVRALFSPTVVPNPSPSPSPSLSPGPVISPSPVSTDTVQEVSPTATASPSSCQSTKIIFYYRHVDSSGNILSTLDEYRALEASANSPVFDIYLSTNSGSVYKRVEHDFDPMLDAVISKLPSPIKQNALGARNNADNYLKVTHNVQIPSEMVSNLSGARILVYVASNRNSSGSLGNSFIFDLNSLYTNYAGPNASGNVMDYSNSVKLENCSPTSILTSTPTPTPISTVSSECKSLINSPSDWKTSQNNQLLSANILWKNESTRSGTNQKASIYLTTKNKSGIVSPSTAVAVMIPDTGEYSYSYNPSSTFSGDQADISKVILRLDQYIDGSLVSSCSKTLALSSGQCTGASCSSLPETLNSILVLGSLLASIAAYLLTAVSSMPLLYRAANSAFALFAPAVWSGKKPSWGIAYDAVSKQPLENVIIRVFSEPSGRLKSTVRSNALGAFGFILPVGKYSLIAAKAGFEFPSKLIIGSTDGRFREVYKGGVFDAAGSGEQKAQINANIPLDRSSVSTFDILQVKSLATISRFFQVIRMPIMILGTISSSYLVITQHKITDYLIGALYVVLWAIEIRNMIKKRSYGIVRDQMGSPLSMVLIRVFDVRGQLKNTVVTGDDGKFQLNLDPGEYKLHVSRGGYKSVRTQEFKIDKIQDIGRLNLRLEKLSGQ